jgi:hypothetical protein
MKMTKMGGTYMTLTLIRFYAAGSDDGGRHASKRTGIAEQSRQEAIRK